MTPRLRAHALQAHSLHCQGLTYRQIGERMKRSPSTVAGYIKAFNTHRDEIIQSLAADQLAHSLAGLNSEDSDLHQQHIDTARELRLQTDTLDRIADRQQRRHRRIQEEEIADTVRDIKATEELAEVLIKNDLWEDTTRLDHFIQTGEIPTDAPNPTSDASNPTSDAPRSDAGPRATNLADTFASLSAPNSPTKPDQHPNNPKPPPRKSEQTRTNPIEPEQDPARSPAKQAKSDSRSEKPEEQPRQQPERRIGPKFPISYHNPTGYVPRRNEEIPLVRELFGRPLSKRPFPRD